MQTIIVSTSEEFWRQAQEAGRYTRSTIDFVLEDGGFIHATSPNQTVAMLNRHFTGRDDVLLLLVDVRKVVPEVRFEKALSGRSGLFPHIYGPLNVDAVIKVIRPLKDPAGQFVEPPELGRLYRET